MRIERREVGSLLVWLSHDEMGENLGLVCRSLGSDSRDTCLQTKEKTGVSDVGIWAIEVGRPPGERARGIDMGRLLR